MNSSVNTATAFLNCFRTKTLQDAPLAEAVRYVSPLAADPVVGRDHVIKFLSAYLPFIREVTVLRLISEGDDVCAQWRADGPFAPLTIVYLLKIKNDQVVDIEASYDPRPFLEGIGSHGN